MFSIFLNICSKLSANRTQSACVVACEYPQRDKILSGVMLEKGRARGLYPPSEELFLGDM